MIEVKDSGKVRIFTINRPPLNTLTPVMVRDFKSKLKQFRKDKAVKAAIITAAGDYFTAGADLKEFAKKKGVLTPWKIARSGQKLFNFIEKSNKPIICAINGVCLGGGTEMAISCHYRIASSRVEMGLPEINLAIIPAWGGTQRLPRLIGSSRAMELILTGRRVAADEAETIGLVDQVVECGELVSTALKVAGVIADKSGIPINSIMKLIRKSLKSSLANGLIFEAKCFFSALLSQDFKEGLKAFKEKRAPEFRDR